MDMSQQNSTALSDESFILNDQDMQANAVKGKQENHQNLLLTQPFTPILSSTEEKPEADAIMEEPLFKKNRDNVAMYEQDITYYENIETQYQNEIGTTLDPAETPLKKFELVDVYRDIALQKGLKADPFMGYKSENL